eukprot:NODE_439_length_1687_cov_118.881563_g321_i0.p1 GENE.NODE_439_length_1687_cov_118.881563_g321_i0~~NODE_439_length_1687_cov_118.881563_g321_i0.p1  ORF type:complete len:468 (-),score=104.96 NODE_439_length_1687_cov_118.881563_g321_i0:223-1626(-)
MLRQMFSDLCDEVEATLNRIAQEQEGIAHAQVALANERQLFDAQKDEKVMAARAALASRTALFEAEQAMLQKAVDGGEVIELNVGGHLYTTQRATLISQPQSVLGVMFSGRWEDGLTRDSAGRVFIDRDGEAFGAVLAVLRRESIQPTADMERRVLELADFLGLQCVAEVLGKGPGGGKLYAVGGQHHACRVSARLEMFDDTTKIWTALPDMATGRFNCGAAVLNDTLYVVGGCNGNETDLLRTCERFDVTTMTWTAIPSMSTPRESMAVAVDTGKLYVVGGCTKYKISGRCEMFDPATTRWTNLPNMPTQRTGPAASVIHGRLYVVGGYGRVGHFAPCEVLDLTLNTWRALPDMPTPRYGLGAAAVDGKLYAIGGMTVGSIGSACCEVFDPAAQMWRVLSDMSIPRWFFGVGVIDGKVCAVGGQTPHGVSGSCEVFDPKTNTWASFPSMITPRSSLAIASGNNQQE